MVSMTCILFNVHIDSYTLPIVAKASDAVFKGCGSMHTLSLPFSFKTLTTFFNVDSCSTVLAIKPAVRVIWLYSATVVVVS